MYKILIYRSLSSAASLKLFYSFVIFPTDGGNLSPHTWPAGTHMRIKCNVIRAIQTGADICLAIEGMKRLLLLALINTAVG